MKSAKLSINQDSLTYQLISKKHGSVTRYYLRNLFLSSDILISKEDALKFVSQNIPSVEDSYQEIQNTVDRVVNGDRSQQNEFPDINDIEDIEWEDDSTVSTEDIEDIGDTVIHAHIPLKSHQVIDVPSEAIADKSSHSNLVIDVPSRSAESSLSEDWKPTIAALTVSDVEAITSLKEENQSLKVQNQELIKELENSRLEQDQISSELALSKEVVSNLKSTVSTLKERLTNSSKDLEQLSNTLKTSVEAFEKAKHHAMNLEELAKYQDEMMNKLEDKIANQSNH